MDLNDIVVDAIYVHRRTKNLYKVVSHCEAKHPDNGGWVHSILYKQHPVAEVLDANHPGLFVRHAGSFREKFQAMYP